MGKVTFHGLVDPTKEDIVSPTSILTGANIVKPSEDEGWLTMEPATLEERKALGLDMGSVLVIGPHPRKKTK